MSAADKQRHASRRSAARARGTVMKLAEQVQEAAGLEEPPSYDELLSLLGAQARQGHVPAIRLLIEEYRRNDDSDEVPAGLAVVDELAHRRSA